MIWYFDQISITCSWSSANLPQVARLYIGPFFRLITIDLGCIGSDLKSIINVMWILNDNYKSSQPREEVFEVRKREAGSERIGSSEKFSPLYSYKMLLHCNLSNVTQVDIKTVVLSSSKLIERRQNSKLFWRKLFTRARTLITSTFHNCTHQNHHRLKKWKRHL